MPSTSIANYDSPFIYNIILLTCLSSSMLIYRKFYSLQCVMKFSSLIEFPHGLRNHVCLLCSTYEALDSDLVPDHTTTMYVNRIFAILISRDDQLILG